MQQQTQLETTETELQSFPISSFSKADVQEESLLIVTDKNVVDTPETMQTSPLAQLTRYRKQAKARYASNLTFGLLLMLLFPVSQSFIPVEDRSILLPLVIVGCVLCSLFIYAITWLQMRAVAKTIADIDDVRMIGPLAEAWSEERSLKPKSVIAALCRLLPRLQASDAHLLTREQRTCLYHAINWRAGRAVYQYDRPLTIAILKALQQIGDKEALPYARRAALSMHKDVREAANDCLKFLVEQAEQHKHGAHLLRPADARTSAPDVLLRASTDMTAQQQTPPEQLLRPHNQE